MCTSTLNEYHKLFSFFFAMAVKKSCVGGKPWPGYYSAVLSRFLCSGILSYSVFFVDTNPLPLYHYDVLWGGGVEVGTKWRKYMKTCFCAFMFKICMIAQKHARFHVFSPFGVHFYPTLVKGLLLECSVVSYFYVPNV